jgi:WD40 repeat protein
MRNVRVLLVVVGLVLCTAVIAANCLPNVKNAPVRPSFYLNPSTEKVKIDFETARSIAERSIPAIKDARMLHGGLIYDKLLGVKVWELEFKTDDGKHISVCVDASTGEVVYVWDESKMSAGKGSISAEEAKKIADSYLRKVLGNSASDLIFSGILYNPSEEKEHAPKYDVHYSRLIKGIPCLSDGITISVNAKGGDVVAYYKVWDIQEKDCINPNPSVSKENATRLLTDYMRREYSTKINILSAKLVWMDVNYPHPMNGKRDVRLVWWIKFDDSAVKSNEMPPAAAWVDAHSGEVLRVVYDIG